MTPAERRERVRILTAAGWTARHIAESLGVTDRTIVRDRRLLGVAQPGSTPMSNEELAAAARLLEDGCSYNDVSRTLGRHRHTLRKMFPGYGWTPSRAIAYRFEQARLEAL